MITCHRLESYYVIICNKLTSDLIMGPGCAMMVSSFKRTCINDKMMKKQLKTHKNTEFEWQISRGTKSYSHYISCSCYYSSNWKQKLIIQTYTHHQQQQNSCLTCPTYWFVTHISEFQKLHSQELLYLLRKKSI